MKIIKDTKTSLLLKSFLLKNQDYLSVSVLCYFDMNNPVAFLEEQAMYREVSQQLGKTMLDGAMAKPKAEVLLCGSCHNHLADEGSSHVRLRVGDINKELYVFGERRWERGIITKALPFKTMPLDLKHAMADGEYLPNIEDPKHLTTTKGETSSPAGFMPIDIRSKENMKKLGTHDAEWKRELWPGFAADMDYSFFNVAPQDQQIEHFFEGGEQIELLNMHPEKQLITSHVPETAFRCFATIAHKNDEDEFKEIKLHRDTLWLFPEIQRGVVIFRGTLAIADEVYSDVKYLNIKPIDAGEPLKSLDEYYVLQKKELDKSVEFDETPFEKADKKIAEAKKEVFDIPRQVKEGVEKTQGKRPTLKRTSAEKSAQSSARIDKAVERMDNSKVKLQELKDTFGHITKIDVNAFEGAKADLLAAKEKIADALQKADEAKQYADTLKKETLDDIQKAQEKIDAKIEGNTDVNVDLDLAFDFLKEKEKVWSDFAFDFVCECVKSLEKNPDALHKLRHLGLAKRTIQRAWIGFNPEERVISAKEWSLESEKNINLAKGLVSVRFEETTLKSIRIDDTLVLGSDAEYELFLSEGNSNFPLFYFTNEIEAYLCDQEVFDICNSLVCEDVSALGDDAKKALEEASIIFYLQEDGTIEQLSNAKRFDCGEYTNLFELHQNGLEIREEIIRNLPKNIQDTLPLERDISAKAIREKSTKITNKVKDDVKKRAQELKKELEDERDSLLANANEILRAKGLDPIDISQTPNSEGFITAKEVGDNLDKAIAILIKKDAKDGIDLKDKISELQEMKEELVTLGKKGEVMYSDALVKIEAAKKRAEEIKKDPIPDWAKEMMQKAGIDPKNPHDTLTREKVIEYHAKGLSFHTKNLSELDLSGLDLSGIDLSMANCKKTNFSKSDLSGANLEQTNLSEANFTQTRLKEVKANMSLFKKSILKKTLFEGFKGDMALFDSVEIKECLFKEAKLDGVVFKEVKLEDTTFEDSLFENTTFTEVNIQKCSFISSKMDKPLFSESTLEECRFLEIDSEGLLFNKSKVLNCDFSGSRLYNLRVLKETKLQNSNLSKCDMTKSTLFEITLQNCNLQQAKLDKSLVKKIELDRCDLRGLSAIGCRFEYAVATESSFAGINLLGGSLRRMDLKRCDFSFANLYGVEFYKAKLYEVNFHGANLKRSGLENRLEFVND